MLYDQPSIRHPGNAAAERLRSTKGFAFVIIAKGIAETVGGSVMVSRLGMIPSSRGLMSTERSNAGLT